MARCRVRLPGLVLVVHMTGDTAGGRAGKRVMAGVMAGYATREGAADATFGVDRGRGRKGRWKSKRERRPKYTHLNPP